MSFANQAVNEADAIRESDDFTNAGNSVRFTKNEFNRQNSTTSLPQHSSRVQFDQSGTKLDDSVSIAG